MAGFSVVMLSLFVILYLVIIAIGIAGYVMRAIAYQTIAKRRGIPNPWLAWIPLANYYLMGSIVDDYDQRNGLKKRWGKIMIGLLIAFGVGMALYFAVVILFAVFAGLNENLFMSEAVGSMVVIFLVLYLTLILYIMIAMALATVSYVCMYKIFESTVPEKSAKYFILSILVPFAHEICLLKCRKQGYANEDTVETPIVENAIIPEAPQTEEVAEEVAADNDVVEAPIEGEEEN